MKARPPSQQSARQRAEVTMKVRCGLRTASQAARQLGVSRKTYYKWEERGLSALLGSLEDQSAGRPQKPVDRHRQALEQQLAQAHIHQQHSRIKSRSPAAVCKAGYQR